ncbi:MAG TPA: hypothetical protein PLX23_12270, partial [Candidatus Hydrogenedens sp.]|nr:hypothetical protein [Candidatus Hydrogenedens sp.]
MPKINDFVYPLLFVILRKTKNLNQLLPQLIFLLFQKTGQASSASIVFRVNGSGILNDICLFHWV